MLTLVPETDSILKTPVTEDFNLSDPDTDPAELARFMIEFMHKNKGIGLAAPQIGLSYRVFVMGEEGFARPYFNPVILESSDRSIKYEEGCLSFPGLYINIVRPEEIVVEYENEYGDVKHERLSGIHARCFQHELDHLNGKVFISRAGGTALALARSRRKKNLRRLST